MVLAASAAPVVQVDAAAKEEKEVTLQIAVVHLMAVGAVLVVVGALVVMARAAVMVVMVAEAAISQ
ncbi:hypothetical protein [uncultured Sulfitobacter sp.]|uniref:hypothetical protein n=1 Tax=uncultured Sulfitobacter sp. TaxID=191468 RepID=UPI0026070A5B|nr:hypothetical protein [uncultured Sulfitobacter sp.]